VAQATRERQGKRDFATRLSPQTLRQLDALVRSGRFRNRTMAIEAAVDRLYHAEQQDQERLRQAFERACGAIAGGTDRDAYSRAEMDRLDWEVAKNTGRR
jgi:Arc/MetJ-type ribon-helix-helix transcriptional regulator